MYLQLHTPIYSLLYTRCDPCTCSHTLRTHICIYATFTYAPTRYPFTHSSHTCRHHVHSYTLCMQPHTCMYMHSWALNVHTFLAHVSVRTHTHAPPHIEPQALEQPGHFRGDRRVQAVHIGVLRDTQTGCFCIGAQACCVR